MNVLIADDEYFIRQKIKKIINWEALELHVKGEAQTGQEVLDLLSLDTDYQILLLDIRMPFVSGLDVAKFIRDHHLNIEIIILSGYSDFEYARTAISYQVSNYLVKPIDSSVLKDALIHAKTNYLIKYKEQQLKEQGSRSIRRGHLYQILTTSKRPIEAYKVYEELQECTHTQILGVFIPDFPQKRIEHFVAYLENHEFIVEYYKEGEYSYIIQLFSPRLPASIKVSSMKVISTYIMTQSSYLFCVVGEHLSIEKRLMPFYKFVKRCLNQRFFYLNQTVFSVSEFVSIQLDTQILFNIRSNLLFFLNSQKKEEFQEYIEVLFEGIKKKGSSDYLYMIVTEIFTIITLHGDHGSTSTLSIPDQVEEVLDDEYQLDRLMSTIINYALSLQNTQNLLPSDLQLSQKVMDYIKEHYREPDLTVSSIAQVFQLNSSYLGSVFKKTTNTSILQYLTSLRMEQSRILLTEHKYKVSEIASMVGYSDVFYYSKRFKKIFGYSPRDYSMRNIMEER